MTPETAAIHLGPDGNDAAGRPVPPQGPYWDLAQARGQANPHPLAAILENGPARRHDPSPIWKPQSQETAYPRNHHGPDVAANPVGRWLTDHRTATTVIKERRPGRPRPTPQSAPPVARSEPRRRAQPDCPKRSPSSPRHAI